MDIDIGILAGLDAVIQLRALAQGRFQAGAQFPLFAL
jgi:hypothetical protein